MPLGLLLGLWEAHKQFLGWAKPVQELDAADIFL